MPKGKTKKFIDKKNSVTFHLVHRSQRDPLIADETAPERVLIPLEDTQASKKKLNDKRKKEQQKYGIYFDDDYDYLKHLRDVNSLTAEWERVDACTSSKSNDQTNAPKINLPSSVFASNVEEKVGLLNKAAPVSGLQLDLDPDIVAAMDDDFDYENSENELEDNFMELANAPISNEILPEKYDQASDVSSEFELSDEEEDEVHSLDGLSRYTFREEETKSRFTEYSMSSSVIRRNEQLTLLDDKFEKMYAGYDEDEIGALDCDEIEGHIAPNSDLVLQCATEFEKQQNENTVNITQLMKDKMKILDKEYSSSEDEDSLEELVVDAREKDKWDCESIISTYSNIYNHPKLISEPKHLQKIKINPRTGIPKNVLNGCSRKLTINALTQFEEQNTNCKPEYSQSIAETMKSTLSTLSIRPKNETSEERKQRKKALKEYRKERRIERKVNREAFKEEKKRQEKILLNNRQNIQGNKIL